MDNSEVRVAIIGVGYWGPNYVRLLTNNDKANLRIVCDKDPSRFGTGGVKKSGAATLTDANKAIDSDVSAVIISTPAATHHELCKKALERGKHVLVEKPLALDLDEASNLFEIAKEKKLVLMTGLVYLYNNAVAYMKNYLTNKRILHISALRSAFGPIRSDVGVIWDLAIHDFALMTYLTNDFPTKVWCVGENLLGGVEDIAISWLRFSKSVASARVSWMDPLKRRELTVVTEDDMIIFDDTNVSAPIQIYEKGVQSINPVADFGQFKFQIKNGSAIFPYFEYGEPLSNEIERFITRIENHETPLTREDKLSLKAIAISSAMNKSLKMGGISQNPEMPKLAQD